MNLTSDIVHDACTDESPLSADLNLELGSNASSLSSSELSSDSGSGNKRLSPEHRVDPDHEHESDPDLSELYTIEDVFKLYTIEDVFNSALIKDRQGSAGVLETLHSLVQGSHTKVDVDDLARRFTDADPETKDKLQLEFVTVLTIIKLSKELNGVLASQMNELSFQKAATISLAAMGLFKYHFQLQQTHPNFGFKNFGSLLSLEQYNLVIPILKTLVLAPKYNYTELEMIKRRFMLLVAMHLMNKYMFDALLSSFAQKDIYTMFTHVFAAESQTPLMASGGLHSFFENFNHCETLAQSSLCEDKDSRTLFGILFPPHYQRIATQSIEALLKMDHLCAKPGMSFEKLNEVLRLYLENDINSEMISLYCWHKPALLNILHKIVDVQSKNVTNLHKVSYYLLANISEFLITNVPLINIEDRALLVILLKINNSNFKASLGITNDSYTYEVTETTMKMLFEIVDQNSKLEYPTELNLLSYLKVSLKNIDYNLNSFESFLNIAALLNDMGCRLSIHALLENVQFVLSSSLNNELFGLVGQSARIPELLKRPFGFEYIPPLGKSNFIFENNLNMGDESLKKVRAQTKEAFKFIQSSTYRRVKGTKLLQDCVLLCAIVKSKVYNFLREFNDELGLMKFSTEQKSAVKDDTMNKFKQRTFTQLALFKSQHGLDYKILNKSVDLNLAATLSSLKICGNYSRFPEVVDSSSLYDRPFCNILYHYQLDSLLSYLLVYKEFGVFSLFKMMKTVLLSDMTLIPIASKVLSNLVGFENSSNKPKIQYVTSIIHQSDVLCSLVRQFVELFDDARSSSFRQLLDFMKVHPSPIKPSKIPKGTVELDLGQFLPYLESGFEKRQAV
ncbi:hypothetical protein KL949_003502 [Ogataea haglerorum]|uniref:Uncharacterized protein n=1 Tax=Ogataea haglerorum TaxID=1937702 RepID=A0ABQ7RII6_9ASCO|nr:hypothetical protein KL914_002680 [Ogataea haglerorum]KAG7716393.1 hypothetical protein KL913_003604 [Ogataea haglerorum]KAG7716906.1 hypothetical protein KL949_003502 [Ogataea haglerorum]KAG7766128.1 hypothetical protein KL946_002308 [Ogataea haglerorum]